MADHDRRKTCATRRGAIWWSGRWGGSVASQAHAWRVPSFGAAAAGRADAGRGRGRVSTRRYAGTFDPVPAEVTERGASSNAVPRRFVGTVGQAAAVVLSRPLDELDLRVVCIDGKVFRDHCMVAALGIGALDALVPLDGAVA